MKPRSSAYLVKVHLLAVAIINEPLKVGLYQRPGLVCLRSAVITISQWSKYVGCDLITCGCGLSEERQHVDVDGINCIQYILSAATFLVAVGKLTDSHRDVQRRKVGLGEYDLLRKLVVWQHVVEERL